MDLSRIGSLFSDCTGEDTILKVACRRRLSADVPRRPRRSPAAGDEARGEFVRMRVRSFRQLVRDRGPRVTWAGMARSPMRLPRRPADSPALPLQHTHTIPGTSLISSRKYISYFVFFLCSFQFFCLAVFKMNIPFLVIIVRILTTSNPCRIESTLAAGFLRLTFLFRFFF